MEIPQGQGSLAQWFTPCAVQVSFLALHLVLCCKFMSVASLRNLEQSSFLLSSLQAPFISMRAVNIHCNSTDTTCSGTVCLGAGRKKPVPAKPLLLLNFEFCIFPHVGRWQEIPQQTRLSTHQFPDLPKHQE